MSRLYFESKDATAELKGWERAHLGGISDSAATGFLNLDVPVNAERISSLTRPGHYMSQYAENDHLAHAGWARAMETALRISSMAEIHALEWKGYEINGWHLMLNTALVAGSDAVRLATRTHAQSELHAWVDGPDRAWLADMIENAQDAGIFRRSVRYMDQPTGMRNADTEPEQVFSGWGGVIRLLRDSDAGPVVMHSSLSDSFPGRHLTGDSPADPWVDMTDADQWDLSVKSLRSGTWSRAYTGLQFRPDDWEHFRFGHCLTLFDLYADDYADRLDKAIEENGL
jgi:hypothetical protein